MATTEAEEHENIFASLEGKIRRCDDLIIALEETKNKMHPPEFEEDDVQAITKKIEDVKKQRDILESTLIQKREIYQTHIVTLEASLAKRKAVIEAAESQT